MQIQRTVVYAAMAADASFVDIFRGADFGPLTSGADGTWDSGSANPHYVYRYYVEDQHYQPVSIGGLKAGSANVVFELAPTQFSIEGGTG